MGTRTTDMWVNTISYFPSATAPHKVQSIGGLVKCVSSRTGVPNPKYKQIISDGGNATTVMSAYRQNVKITPGSTVFIFKDKAIGTDSYHGINPAPIPITHLDTTAGFPQSIIDEATAAAISQMYKSIAKFQSPFQGQVFAGELHEVYKLIRNPLATSNKLLESWVKAVSAPLIDLRNKGLKSKVMSASDKAAAKAVADSWLELRFAILPLISDIGSLMTLAADIALTRQHETLRAYGKSESAASYVQLVNSTTGLAYNRSQEHVFKCENIIRCGLTAEFLDKFEQNVNPYIDAVDDVMSIPLTVWELTPFSFLVDYFVNVQDIIQSSVVTSRALSYTSNSIIKMKTIETYTGAPFVGRPDLISTIASHVPKRTTESVRSVQRGGVLQAIPPVVFSLPGSKVRYANIAALLTKLI